MRQGHSALELRIPPLALMMLFALAMVAMARVMPAGLILPSRNVIALGLVSAGAIFALAGVACFLRHHTTVNPMRPEQSSSLVTTCIYRFTRNPMYLGFLLALAAWGVYLANWASLLLLPVFIAYMNRYQIGPEERALRQGFGQEFVAYTQKVRRWV